MKNLIIYNVFFIIIFLLSVSCKKKDVDPDNNSDKLDSALNNQDKIQNMLDTCVHDSCRSCNLSDFGQQVYDQMMEAYDNNCKECLEKIFDEWNSKYKTIDINSIENDTIRNIYEIFYEIYTPWDFYRLTGDKNDSIYCIFCKYKYFIIQDKIAYSFDFNEKTYNRDTIENFYPKIKSDTFKLLSFEYKGDYHKAIYCFLGPMLPGDTTQPIFPWEESVIRSNFLEPYVNIFVGHWMYWIYETMLISEIAFNEYMDSAIVFYYGWEFKLAKSINGWEFKESELVWIE